MAAQYGKLGERVFRVTQTHMVRPMPRVQPHRRFTNRGADNLSESADAGLVSFKYGARCGVLRCHWSQVRPAPRTVDLKVGGMGISFFSGPTLLQVR